MERKRIISHTVNKVLKVSIEKTRLLTFLQTVYRGMYGQFYIATLLDGNQVLLLVGCNDMDAVEAGDYTNMVAKYHTQVVEGMESNYKNDVSKQLQQLEASMSVAGYGNIADISWAT